MLNLKLLQDINSTGNHSVSSEKLQLTWEPICSSTLVNGLVSTLQAIILVLSLANVLVIQVIRQSPRLRSVVDLLIVNMSVSDLFIPIFSIPYVLKVTHSGNVWLDGTLGTILRKFVPFAMDLSTTVSIFCMLTIAMERLHCVTCIKNAKLLSSKLGHRLNALIWIIAVSTQCPHLVGYNIVSSKSDVLCLNTWYPRNQAFRIYHVILTIFVIIVPMVLITMLYTTVIILLYRQKSRIAGYLSSKGLKQRRKENSRSTFMLMILITMFIMAYVPYVVVITMDFFNTLNVQKYCEVILIFLSVFYSPSALSPIIYFGFNKRYRRGLKRLFRCASFGCVSTCNSADFRGNKPLQKLPVKTVKEKQRK